MQGLLDVCAGADGGKDIVEHTAYLDIAERLLLVFTLDEIAAFVALTELGLDVEGLDSDRLGPYGLQEDVLSGGIGVFGVFGMIRTS